MVRRVLVAAFVLALGLAGVAQAIGHPTGPGYVEGMPVQEPPRKFSYADIEEKNMTVERRIQFAWFQKGKLWIYWTDTFFDADGKQVGRESELWYSSIEDWKTAHLSTADAEREAVRMERLRFTKTGGLMAPERLRVIDETALPIEGERLEALKKLFIPPSPDPSRPTLLGALDRPVSLEIGVRPTYAPWLDGEMKMILGVGGAVLLAILILIVATRPKRA